MYEFNYIKIRTFHQKSKRHHGVRTRCKNLENRESGKEKRFCPPATTVAAADEHTEREWRVISGRVW